ncbi:hypothetical protein J3459_015395 [Metarhizium acridum]|nr:hypothetical protein J3459_015395 [Metarhizium acridum]
MVCPTQIKFYVPEECRTFTEFPRLPPEVRQRIWETYLSTPGVHFLKLQTKEGDWSWTERRMQDAFTMQETEGTEDGEEMPTVLENDRMPRESHQACLIPVGPCPRADVSQYQALRRQLAILSRTCVESRNVARRLADRPETLRLGNGSIVSLGRSSDLIYLDYFPQSLYQSSGNLETIPDCPDLARIKRVAVRFSHTWWPTKKLCTCDSCRKSNGLIHRGVYPAHLYQLLARHFPNLEEFFFIDYFIVHKGRCQHKHDGTSVKGPTIRTKRFQAGNRSYHEANEEEWIIKKNILQITEWLRSSFVSYAMNSPLCHHKNPDKVRFAVLACEWNISSPAEKPATSLVLETKLKTAGMLLGGSIRRHHSLSKRHQSWLSEAEALNNQPSNESFERMMGTEDARGTFVFPSLSTVPPSNQSPHRHVQASQA